MKNYIYLIPVRAGSKRVPNKNILDLCSKPLFTHSVDFAKKFTSNENIYVLTDSEKAKKFLVNLMLTFLKGLMNFQKTIQACLKLF